MKSASTQYASFRTQLQSERDALSQRIARIDETLQALDGLAGGAPARTRGRVAARAPRRRGGRRAANTMSLREAINKALSSGPLTKPEILAAVKKAGYTFTASNPMNSLNVQLYTKGQFKKLPGKRFSPTK